MYRYLAFDLDGTLIDSMPQITESVNFALEACGLAAIPAGRNLSWFVGPPLREGFRKLIDTKDDSLNERLVVAYRDRYRDALLGSRLYPGMQELLAELSAVSTLTLATTKPTVFANRILENLRINRLFSEVVGSELDGARSTKEELIEHVISLCGGSPSDYLFVGDRATDVVGARANGVDSLAVLYGYGSASEIQGSNPKFVARDVEELRRVLRPLTGVSAEAQRNIH